MYLNNLFRLEINCWSNQRRMQLRSDHSTNVYCHCMSLYETNIERYFRLNQIDRSRRANRAVVIAFRSSNKLDDGLGGLCCTGSRYNWRFCGSETAIVARSFAYIV